MNFPSILAGDPVLRTGGDVLVVAWETSGQRMILELAILNVKPGQSAAFEQAMAGARPLIAATPGFRGIEVRPCVEAPGRRYALLVWWDTLEDHTVGFRQSDRYQAWRAALHHFYDPFPVVEHFALPLSGAEAVPPR